MYPWTQPYPGLPLTPTYDPATHQIYAGLAPLSLGYSPFYSVVVSDPWNLTLPGTSFTMAGPVGSMAYDPTNHLIYASEANVSTGNATVQAIDPANRTVGPAYPLGTYLLPGATVYDPKNHNLYAATGHLNTVNSRMGVAVFDTLTSTAEAPLVLPPGFVPLVLAADSNDSTLFVAGRNYVASQPIEVVAVNLSTGLNRSMFVPLTGTNWRPGSLAFDPIDNSIYVGCGLLGTAPLQDENVSVINASTLALEVEIPLAPVATSGTFGVAGSLTYDPDNHDLYLGQNPDVYGISGGDYVGTDQTVAVLNGSTAITANPVAFLTVPADLGSVYVPAASPSQGSELWISNATSGGYAGAYSVLGLPPTIGSFAASPPSLEVGTPLSLAASVALGAGTLNYSYTGLPPGCGTQNATMLACAPTTPGTSTVTFTVTDQFGQSASAVASVDVRSMPSDQVTVSAARVDVGQSLQFDSSPGGGLAPYSIAWTFGDGSPGAPGLDVSHIYTQASSYPVTAVLTDGLGGTNTTSITVNVSERPHNATIVSNRSGSPVGGPFAFSAVVSGGALPLTYSWSFGDGSSGSGATADHSFGRAGTFSVNVTILDGAGVSVTARQTVVVGPSAGSPPTATSSTSGVPAEWVYAGIAGGLVVGLAIGLVGASLSHRRRVPPPTVADRPGVPPP